jgi:hypothetical protein
MFASEHITGDYRNRLVVNQKRRPIQFKAAF